MRSSRSQPVSRSFPDSSVLSRRKLGGILVRRECWTLSRLGWLIVAAIAVTAVAAGQKIAYPFLAVTERTLGEVFVVEGWIPADAIRDAAAEFRRGRYRHLVVVIGESGADGNGAHWDKGAHVVQLLGQYDVPAARIKTLEYMTGDRDRTYRGALAVKSWLAAHVPDAKAIDVATSGTHARRSRLLYEKAFGRGISIGVISLPNGAYDPAHWWRSSEGVREVSFEAIAYLYARFLFRPFG